MSDVHPPGDVLYVLEDCFDWLSLEADGERPSFLIDAIKGAIEQVGALRAVLEPLLDHPYQSGGPYFAPHQECRFCRAILGDERHDPTCPVLRRDALLGRSATV
jgi:hypothetical protein